MKDFMNTPYGRDFFRDIQKIAISVETLALSDRVTKREEKSMHQHRVGAAQRISLAVSYIDENKEQLSFTDGMDIHTPDVLTMLEALRNILLKSS